MPLASPPCPEEGRTESARRGRCTPRHALPAAVRPASRSSPAATSPSIAANASSSRAAGPPAAITAPAGRRPLHDDTADDARDPIRSRAFLRPQIHLMLRQTAPSQRTVVVRALAHHTPPSPGVSPKEPAAPAPARRSGFSRKMDLRLSRRGPYDTRDAQDDTRKFLPHPRQYHCPRQRSLPIFSDQHLTDSMMTRGPSIPHPSPTITPALGHPSFCAGLPSLRGERGRG